MRKLTMKQKRFADEYLISGNAKQAAIKAGYSRKSSYSIGEENLRKPELLSYIEERLQYIESESIAKQEEILKYLTSVMRGEQKEAILIGMGDGVQEITYIEVSAKERIRAAALLGKRYRLWVEKQEINTTVHVNPILENILEQLQEPDEEITEDDL